MNMRLIGCWTVSHQNAGRIASFLPSAVFRGSRFTSNGRIARKSSTNNQEINLQFDLYKILIFLPSTRVAYSPWLTSAVTPNGSFTTDDIEKCCFLNASWRVTSAASASTLLSCVSFVFCCSYSFSLRATVMTDLSSTCKDIC